MINADDYGMTLPISRGILKAVAAGSVLIPAVRASRVEPVEALRAE